jgi:hypothetical protein
MFVSHITLSLVSFRKLSVTCGAETSLGSRGRGCRHPLRHHQLGMALGVASLPPCPASGSKHNSLTQMILPVLLAVVALLDSNLCSVFGEHLERHISLHDRLDDRESYGPHGPSVSCVALYDSTSCASVIAYATVRANHSSCSPLAFSDGSTRHLQV